jgi:DNA (cytosine-5)-methyltransferase 1
MTAKDKPVKSRILKAIDLFSGCGGLSQGLKSVGYRVVAAVEVDETAARVYKRNHRKTRVFAEDITKLEPKFLMNEIGIAPNELDLLAGCPPCQGFSSLRTRNGAAKNRDARNKLVNEMLRFVKVLKPKAVMLENVPKLATHSSFLKLVRDLRSLGYNVTYSVENAADYGVPQRRKRLIMLAAKKFQPELLEPTFERTTVRDAIGNLPLPNTTNDNLHTIDLARRSDRIMKLIETIPKNGGSRSSLPESMQLDCHKGKKGFNDVYGRMAWDSVSPTITGGCYNPSKGRFLHPQQDRPITLREAALLQGFPKRYYFDHSIGMQATALMIGNALPPAFVAYHAKEVAKKLLAK